MVKEDAERKEKHHPMIDHIHRSIFHGTESLDSVYRAIKKHGIPPSTLSEHTFLLCDELRAYAVLSAERVTAVAALAVAFFSASQDIVIDAYRIEILDSSEQGAGAAMTQAGYRLGAIVAGAGALFLAEQLDWSLVYLVMAGLVVIGMAAAIFAPDPEQRRPELAETGWTPGIRAMIVDPFVEFFQRNGPLTAVIILGFILLYKFGDAYAGVMAYPFYYEMGFSKSEVATVSKIFGVIATVIGVFVGGAIVKRYGIMRSLLGCGIVQMLSNLMYAGQSLAGHDVQFLYFTIGIENLSGGMGSAAFVAYLSVLCNTSFTGTQYALLTSFMAIGRTFLSASSGWVVELTGWFDFFVISTVIALPGLLLLLWMMKHLPITAQTGVPEPRRAAAEST